MFAKKFRKQQTILLKVSREILLNQNISYCDNENCFLARAVKEQFGKGTNVYVRSTGVRIEGVQYDILGGMGSCSFLERFRTHPNKPWGITDGEYFIAVPLVKSSKEV
jgi:hypothetical protein